jgi:CAAX prenyl protease-like protein
MTESQASRHPALLYVIPVAGFVLLTSLEEPVAAGGSAWPALGYPLAYTAKVLVVSALAWACRRSWRDLNPLPSRSVLALAIGLGLLVAIAWVGLDGRYPALPGLGKRTGFDPGVLSPPGRWCFLAVRFFGLVILVPLIEELFWRSFAIRLIIDADFERIPIGRVTPMAAAVTSTLFGLTHPEWLPALLTGAVWAWLLWRTRSVAACVVSHAVANLALGVYVIGTGDWKFW